MVGKFIITAVSLGLLAGASALAADPPASAAPATGPFKFDRGHTNITFSLSHFGFSTAYGMFESFEPSVSFDPAKPEKTTLEVKIDAASLKTGWPARDEELRGEHFFNVAKYPAITFKSTKVERTGETSAKLTGDLTMLGVTKPLTLDVTLVKRGPHTFRPSIEVNGFAATGVLKRSDYGMIALLPGLGDEVSLVISAEINNALPKPKS
jgi:polyisoprenoid-binding protein YceI